jgi:hypothetical protein
MGDLEDSALVTTPNRGSDVLIPVRNDRGELWIGRSELLRSGGRHGFLVVASESDVDREVGEQVGHLGSVAKLGRRPCARAHMEAVGLVGFHSSARASVIDRRCRDRPTTNEGQMISMLTRSA